MTKKPRYPRELRLLYEILPVPKAEPLSQAKPDKPVLYSVKAEQSIYDDQLAYVIYHKGERVGLCWSREQAEAKRDLLEAIADGRIERFYIKPKRAAFHIHDRLSPSDVKWIARSSEEAMRVVERLNQAEQAKHQED